MALGDPRRRGHGHGPHELKRTRHDALRVAVYAWGSVARIDRDPRGFSKGLGVSFEGIDTDVRDLDALKGFLSKTKAA